MKVLFSVVLLSSTFPCGAVRHVLRNGGDHQDPDDPGNETGELMQWPPDIIPSIRVAMPLPGFTGDNCMRKGGVISALYELVCGGAMGREGDLKVLAWSLKKAGDLSVGSSWYEKANANTVELQDRFGTGCTFEDFWRKTVVSSLSTSNKWPSREEQDEFYEQEARRMLMQAKNMGIDTVAYYLSIPPSAFGTWATAVGKVKKLAPNVRIVVEKPLGRDLGSFQQLMHTFQAAHLSDQELYLLDHYSGKEMIMSMPFLFGKNHDELSLCRGGTCRVSRVRVVQLEARDVAGRDFEDIGGQVRDMVQSHLLQMLATFVAGEGVKPRCPKCRDVQWATAKLHVLKSFQVVSARLAQYEGYLEDGGTNQRRAETPTYACLQLRSSLQGWQNTIFEIETAKSVDQRIAYVEVTTLAGDVMRVSVQPEMGIQAPASLAERWGKLKLHRPGLGSLRFSKVTPHEVSPGTVIYSPQGGVPSAYAYIFEAVFQGNHKLFGNMEEVEKQWLLVQDFLEAEEGVHLPRYAKGTPAKDVYDIALQI